MEGHTSPAVRPKQKLKIKPNQNISLGSIIRIAACLLGLFACQYSQLYSQSGSFWDDTDLTPFRAGGSIGLSVSGYTVNGIENRRAPGLFQTFANFNFTSFGLNSGLNLNYSTDDSGFRQNMNNLSYNVNWRWMTIRAGDVSTRFSDFSLNGTPIRGGYIRATPGNFLFEVIGGRSRRVVRPSLDDGFREPSFEQWAFGGKIGIGKKSGDYFHLSTFYAQDNVASLEGNLVEIKPKENLSLTPDFSIGFFDGKLNLESQVTVSVFTRDLNSSKISSDDLGIPGFVTGIYQPFVSTKINYAGKALADFRSDLFDLGVGYERIQPGFFSLGMANIRNDQEKIIFTPAIRLFNNRLSFQSNITLGRDNLLGTRLQTQSNTNISTSFRSVFSNSFSVSGVYNLLMNDVEFSEPESQGLGSGAGGQSQVAHNIMLQPNFVFMGEQTTHNFSLSGGFIHIESALDGTHTSDFSSFDSKSYVGTVSYAISLPVGLTLNSAVNYLTNQSSGSSIKNVGMSLGTSYAMLDQKLTLSIQLNHNRNHIERELVARPIDNRLQQYSGGVNAAYRLSNKDTFNLTLRTRNNRVVEGSGKEFTELEGSFRYQRTF